MRGAESVTAVNPIERLLRKADGTQQKYHSSAFVFGVIKKYGDDNGGVLAKNLAHSVVLARRLWPRSIIQPPLTEADRASLALLALGNQRREEQQVVVTFTDRQPGTPAAPTTPRTPDEISPPALRKPRRREMALPPEVPRPRAAIEGPES